MEKKQTILLVEDEEPLRKPLRKVLEFNGYAVIEADSGSAALEIWTTQKPEVDLLLTDIRMPGSLNGYDLAEMLWRDQPNLKVVFSTGQKNELLAKGFPLREDFNFLQKPYDPQQLLTVIRNNLGKV